MPPPLNGGAAACVVRPAKTIACRVAILHTFPAAALLLGGSVDTFCERVYRDVGSICAQPGDEDDNGFRACRLQGSDTDLNAALVHAILPFQEYPVPALAIGCNDVEHSLPGADDAAPGRATRTASPSPLH